MRDVDGVVETIISNKDVDKIIQRFKVSRNGINDRIIKIIKNAELISYKTDNNGCVSKIKTRLIPEDDLFYGIYFYLKKREIIS